MRLKLKIILILLAFVVAVYLAIEAWIAWTSIEAAKGDDYNIFVRTGYEVNEPVLEVK